MPNAPAATVRTFRIGGLRRLFGKKNNINANEKLGQALVKYINGNRNNRTTKNEVVNALKIYINGKSPRVASAVRQAGGNLPGGPESTNLPSTVSVVLPQTPPAPNANENIKRALNALHTIVSKINNNKVNINASYPNANRNTLNASIRNAVAALNALNANKKMGANNRAKAQKIRNKLAALKGAAVPPTAPEAINRQALNILLAGVAGNIATIMNSNTNSKNKNAKITNLNTKVKTAAKNAGVNMNNTRVKNSLNHIQAARNILTRQISGNLTSNIIGRVAAPNKLPTNEFTPELTNIFRNRNGKTVGTKKIGNKWVRVSLNNTGQWRKMTNTGNYNSKNNAERNFKPPPPTN